MYFLSVYFLTPLSINTVVLVHPDQSVLFLLVLSVSVVEYGQVTPFSCANGIYNVLTILFYYFLVVREQILCFCNEGMSEFIKTNMSQNCFSVEIRKLLEFFAWNISAVKKWLNHILDIVEEAKAFLVMNGTKDQHLVEWESRNAELQQRSRIEDIIVTGLGTEPGL